MASVHRLRSRQRTYLLCSPHGCFKLGAVFPHQRIWMLRCALCCPTTKACCQRVAPGGRRRDNWPELADVIHSAHVGCNPKPQKAFSTDPGRSRPKTRTSVLHGKPAVLMETQHEMLGHVPLKTKWTKTVGECSNPNAVDGARACYG